MSWGKEPITAQKLNDMVDNMDYLYEKMLTGYYDINGLTRDSGLTIRIGHVKVPQTENTANDVVHFFSRPFMPGTRPVVLISLASEYFNRIFIAMRGLDGRATADHRGFVATFSQDRTPGGPTEYSGEQFLQYVAFGYMG